MTALNFFLYIGWRIRGAISRFLCTARIFFYIKHLWNHCGTVDSSVSVWSDLFIIQNCCLNNKCCFRPVLFCGTLSLLFWGANIDKSFVSLVVFFISIWLARGVGKGFVESFWKNVEIPSIKVGKRQTLETMINEEVLLFEVS